MGKDGLKAACKECRRANGKQYNIDNAEKKRAYRAANRERIRARDKTYYEKNKETICARVQQYQAENREECLERSRQYRAEHLEELREKERERARNASEEQRVQARRRARLWYVENKERAQEYARQYRIDNRERVDKRVTDWMRDNPEAARAIRRNRKARLRAAEGSHSASDVTAQYDRQGGRCYYCEESVGEAYHVDHVIPLSLGGRNSPDNLVIACPDCNLSKGGKHPMEFAGRLL